MKNFKKPILACMTALVIVSFIGCEFQTNKKNSEKVDNTVKSTEVALKNLPKFKGNDFEGNKVDESIFKENKVTILNFWFNGCPGCINEMPALEKFNKMLKKNGVQIIGVNVEANNGDNKLKEAKNILKKQGVTYRNIMISKGKEAEEYLSKITIFPKTILVDKSGKIIGQPIVGNIENKKLQQDILEIIKKASSDVSTSEETIDPSKAKVEKISEVNDEKKDRIANPELDALNNEMDKIFTDHKDIWDKVFENAPKENAKKINKEISYGEYLNKALEKSKNSLTQKEQKIIQNDIEKIKILDKKMISLDKKK